MTTIDLIRRLHQHRQWVNHQLLTAAETLPAEATQQSFAIGQGTVWKTLLHLYAAEWVWLETLLGDEFPTLPGDVPDLLPGNQLGEGAITSIGELRGRWTDLDRRWRSYLDQLTPERLTDTVFKISTSSGAGKRLASRRADILLHVCTHAQYTVAQLVNMFRQLGVSPLPDVMLISLARQEAAGTS